LPKSGSKIIGFHGKAGWYLDAIGVHTQPIPKENNPSSKILLHSHQSFSQGDKKHEYSVLQGSVGQNFDIVVTLRKKDPTLPSFESRDSAGAEVTKHKVMSRLFCYTFEKQVLLDFYWFLNNFFYGICFISW